MSEITQGEKYLLEQIRRGDNDAWSQLVERYQGRLLTFARAKVPQRADCEDIVQETFIAFVKNLACYRQDCGLETFLFAILRRKITDCFRKRHSKEICLIQDVHKPTRYGELRDAFSDMISPEHTGSWYARRDEQHHLQRRALTEGLSALVNGFKKSLNFQDLEIVELLFYCQLSNKDTAAIMNVSERKIGVTKHRCLKQVRGHIAKMNVPIEPLSSDLENLLNEVWQSQRLSCPKRSTIGAYLLGTLDQSWHGYVDFHLNRLGCHFCRANLEDLRRQNADAKRQDLRVRIMESTVGFLHKPSL